MLEFKVVLDKTDAQRYLREHGIDTDISKMMVMSVCENGEIVGVGAVSMDASGAVIEENEADDDSVAYGMGKALLNSLDLGGVRNVTIENDALTSLAKRLRFTKKDNNRFELCLDGYFTGGC